MPLIGVPPFFDFLATQKNAQKSTPQKTIILPPRGDFLDPHRPILVIWGAKMGSRSGLFSTIFLGPFFVRILTNF